MELLKTTIKLSSTRAIRVEQADKSGFVLLEFPNVKNEPEYAYLTPDQCGALIFGIEQALEVIDQRHRQALATIRAAA